MAWLWLSFKVLAFFLGGDESAPPPPLDAPVKVHFVLQGANQSGRVEAPGLPETRSGGAEDEAAEGGGKLEEVEGAEGEGSKVGRVGCTYLSE